MARAAGDNPYYTFTLHNDSTGRYDKTVQIKLPSTSTIVKQTLAAPALVPWAYKVTRDNISGMIGVIQETENWDVAELLDMLIDADWLDEYLKENKLRPDDVRDASSERGTREHATLERLANLGLDDSERMHEEAQKIIGHSKNPYEQATAQWIADFYPTIVESEAILPCPQYGYCGSTDLVWADGHYQKVVVDLKTRRAGLGAYESDFFQVDGYHTAYDLLNPTERAYDSAILLAYDDGTYEYTVNPLPAGSFLKLKEVWDLLRYVKGRR